MNFLILIFFDFDLRTRAKGTVLLASERIQNLIGRE